MSNDHKFYDDTRTRPSSYIVGNTKIIFDRKSRGRNPIHRCVRPPAYYKQVRGILKEHHNSKDSVGRDRSIKSELLAVHRDTPFTPYTRRCASFSDRKVEFSDELSTAEPSVFGSAESRRSSNPDRLSTILANLAQARKHNDEDMRKNVACQLLAKVSAPRSTTSSLASLPVVGHRVKRVVCKPAHTQQCQITSSISESDIDCDKKKKAQKKKRVSKLMATVDAAQSKAAGCRRAAQIERIPVRLRKRVRRKLKSTAKTKSKAAPTMPSLVDDAANDPTIGAKVGEESFKTAHNSTTAIDRSAAYDLISNFSRVLKTLKERKFRCDAKMRRRMLTGTGVFECPASRSLLADIYGASENVRGTASASSLSSETVGSSPALAGDSSDGSWSSAEGSADESTTPVPQQDHVNAQESKRHRHIHPCVCDLTKAQREKIEQYLNERLRMQMRFEKRIKEIEEELQKLAEEQEERHRREQLEKEMYDDEYEMIGGRRRRKKRSARRVSMVSLGVRQVINWRKEPKIAVKYTRTYELRRANPTYCKPKVLSFAQEPKPIPSVSNLSVRHNRTSELRAKFSKDLRELLNKREYRKYPNRPEFVLKIR